MQILDWITCRRVEKKESASFFCLVLLYIFAHAVALAQQPGVQAASTPFESTTLGAPARDSRSCARRMMCLLDLP